MKFWNKDKEIRKRCWTVVARKHYGSTSNYELKRWCQQHPSKGKFYYYYGSCNWWFERPQDATLFALMWLE